MPKNILHCSEKEIQYRRESRVWNLVKISSPSRRFETGNRRVMWIIEKRFPFLRHIFPLNHIPYPCRYVPCYFSLCGYETRVMLLRASPLWSISALSRVCVLILSWEITYSTQWIFYTHPSDLVLFFLFKIQGIAGMSPAFTIIGHDLRLRVALPLRSYIFQCLLGYCLPLSLWRRIVSEKM